MTGFHSVLVSKDIDVYSASLIRDPEELEGLRRLLSEDELIRSKMLLKPERARTFIAQRGLLRILLADVLNLEPIQIEFAKGPQGKPSIAQGRLNFSFSSSKDEALFAVSKSCVLGIDIEALDEEFPFEDILPVHFTDSERTFIFRNGDPRRSFFQAWTLKEACAKAEGYGMAKSMQEYEVAQSGSDSIRLDSGLQVRTLSVSPGFLGALAWKSR